ncbi:MAG: sulfatase-like hydrolase/transferase [Chlamydiales bacterium]
MEAKKINYLYFGALFLLLTLLASSSIFTKENISGSQPFFFLYALGQATMEILLLTALSLFIPRYFGKLFFNMFIGCTFFILFFHIADFLMDRILDLTVWAALRIFIFDENLQNFLYLLDATGVSLWIWVLTLALILTLPLIGVFLYRITDALCQKKSLSVTNGQFLQAFICIPTALLCWEFSVSNVIHPDAYTAFIKSLPWKFTILQPKNVLLNLRGPLEAPLAHTTAERAIDQDQTVLAAKPNIYLFVVESLREDSITPEIAPHLAQFKTQAAHFEQAVSNGNGTHLSWFSIFHSQFPYHWKHFQEHWPIGSLPLAFLKKWGYQIRLYSSAELGYYGMDELLFGKELHLLASRQLFHRPPPFTPADSDKAALFKLQEDIQSDPALQQGQVFIIFWDGTHFDYSLPKDWTPPFTPSAQGFVYFQAFHSQKAIRSILNRYHNAVHHMDQLFGHFLEHLPNKEEAIILFTGDHGQEFFEHGHIFHNSHLTREQTHIPLYLKLGRESGKIIDRPLVSQMDLFPTLLAHLSGSSPILLEGNSLLEPPKWPYAITARFNAGRTPYEFAIHNGKHKMIAQFLNRKEILKAKHLRMISLRTNKDASVNERKVEAWVDQEFGPALQRLFDE